MNIGPPRCNWSKKGSVAINAGGNLWVQVDLGKDYAVDKVNYRSTALGDGYNGYVQARPRHMTLRVFVNNCWILY